MKAKVKRRIEDHRRKSSKVKERKYLIIKELKRDLERDRGIERERARECKKASER